MKLWHVFHNFLQLSWQQGNCGSAAGIYKYDYNDFHNIYVKKEKQNKSVERKRNEIYEVLGL